MKPLLKKTVRNTKGQATVEAAFLIPILMLLILLLCQPIILLYNRMVMESAATEACRLLATGTSQGAYTNDKYEGYVKRRLAAIPPIDIFHAHAGSKTWDILLTGQDSSQTTGVQITNKLKPLPLLGWGTQLLGMCDTDGYLTQEVKVSMPTQPVWAWQNSSGSPADWVHNYD
jgi:Flp pilus assembly protein TadG